MVAIGARGHEPDPLAISPDRLIARGIRIVCVNLQRDLHLRGAIAISLCNRTCASDEVALVPCNPAIHRSHARRTILCEFRRPDTKVLFDPRGQHRVEADLANALIGPGFQQDAAQLDVVTHAAVDLVSHLTGYRHPGNLGADQPNVEVTTAHEFEARDILLCQFLDHLNVVDNIALPLAAAGQDSLADGANLKELLNWVGLGHRADALPPELSGGERQRAALARAVIMSPDIILADEPTGNVDWEMSQRLLQLLVELNRMGKTVVIASHDLSLIRAAKTEVQARVLRIYNKRVQLAGANL